MARCYFERYSRYVTLLLFLRGAIVIAIYTYTFSDAFSLMPADDMFDSAAFHAGFFMPPRRLLR